MNTLAFLLQTAIVTRALFLMPFEGKRKYERLVADLKLHTYARVRFFARFLLSWWAIAAVVLASIALGSDTRAQLRLVAPDFAVAVPLVLAWILFVSWPVLRARTAGPYRDAIREQLARVPAMLPATTGERWMFAAVSVTAGICEELVFRGLMPFYFAKLLPGFTWVGPLVSVIGFGVAHAYQGRQGIVLATLLAAILMGATALTGSVWTAMLMHAVNDLRFLALVITLGRPVVDKPGESP